MTLLQKLPGRSPYEYRGDKVVSHRAERDGVVIVMMQRPPYMGRNLKASKTPTIPGAAYSTFPPMAKTKGGWWCRIVEKGPCVNGPMQPGWPKRVREGKPPTPEKRAILSRFKALKNRG